MGLFGFFVGSMFVALLAMLAQFESVLYGFFILLRKIVHLFADRAL